MKTIAILSNKGGAGKTTLATNLAVAASKAGQTAVLIDLDPQPSSVEWKETREEETPVVARMTAAQLPDLIEALKADGETDVVFIDTAPRTEDDAKVAARVADFALVPCRPSDADMRSIRKTFSIAQYEQVPAVVVFNAVPARGRLRERALAVLEGYKGQRAIPNFLGQRVAFMYAYIEGLSVLEWEPRGTAAGEIRELYKYVCEQVGGI